MSARKPPAKRRGRPPVAEASRVAAVVSTRLSEAEREACELAAQREGKSLSEWVRNTLLLRAASSG